MGLAPRPPNAYAHTHAYAQAHTSNHTAGGYPTTHCTTCSNSRTRGGENTVQYMGYYRPYSGSSGGRRRSVLCLQKAKIRALRRFPAVRFALYYVVTSGDLTSRSGVLPPLRTLSAVLPNAQRVMPDHPCVDIATKSACTSSASLIIS